MPIRQKFNSNRRGVEENTTIKKCTIFNINTFEFSSIADMKEERKNFALVECNNKLYAIGGRNNEDNGLFSIETYNKKTNIGLTQLI